MADKTILVPKPDQPKPVPVKPAPVTPKKPTPAKCCARCDTKITEETGVVRSLCSACDRDLQQAHWNVEHVLFGRVTYMPKDAEPSPDWLTANGYEVRKPPPPRQRNYFKPRTPPPVSAPKAETVSEAMAL